MNLHYAAGPPPIPIKSEHINRFLFSLNPQMHYPSGSTNYYNPHVQRIELNIIYKFNLSN